LILRSGKQMLNLSNVSPRSRYLLSFFVAKSEAKSLIRTKKDKKSKKDKKKNATAVAARGEHELSPRSFDLFDIEEREAEAEAELDTREPKK
jgi:hypothetical protein